MENNYTKVASYEAKEGTFDKVLLLYSGGLDTSVMLKWIQDEYNAEVYALCVDIGQREDFEPVVQKALNLGAKKCEVADMRYKFALNYCYEAIAFNADYEGGYHLFCPLGRIAIAEAAVEYARKWGINVIAHGATGKGNDQIRFDNYITTQNPELKILAPVREWSMGREAEIEYAKQHNIPVTASLEKIYSYDENLWGCSAEGGEIEDLVGRTITMYDMGVPEPAYYDISRVEMSPPQFSIKSLKLYHKHGMNEFVDVIEGADINKFLKGEQVDLRDSGGDYYAIQLTEKMESKMKKGGDLKVGYKDAMMFDKNGERRVDPEAIAYIENTNAMLTQTKFLHTDKNGKYTPSRRKLHEKIIAHFHEDKPCVNKRPAIAILTGGAPASGKTTFIKKFVDLDPEKVYHIDADEVRAMLPEYKGWNASQTHLETADIVNRLIDDIGEPCDHDMIYDGTMNKATKYEKIVDKLHKLGYKVFVVYISIPEQVSKERVISRYQKAGRYVPMQVIEEVYDNGLTAFEKVAREMADGYIRIDGMNGDVLEKGGMEMPKNIEYAQGGEVDSSYLKNADSLVRSAERYAQETSGKEVSKGKGMARASKKDGKMKYTEVIVFFKNGNKEVYDESEFPKFFMKDGGEVGSQDYYDGFQMQVVTKKGNPDKEVQKQNAMFKYRKGGKL